MAGVLFIVNVPRKEHEGELRKKERSSKIVIEKDKYDKTSKIVDELKENKKFGSIRSTMEPYPNEEDCTVISKCKSTDCLHKNDRELGLYKSKSDNNLNVDRVNSECVRKSRLKSSWEEIKQVINPRRNKIKITRPGRGVDILAAFHWDTPLETILSEIIFRLDIKNAAWNSTKDDKFCQVTFSLESGNLCEELLQVLRTFGIGSRHDSSVSVIPCALYFKSGDDQPRTEQLGIQREGNSAWTRFSSSVRARNNLAQVLHDVRAEAALTFDWLFLLVVAAFVAAIGLVENSTVILVASMLISPLMGPITAGTLGTAVRDRSLQQMGVMHELFGLFLSLVIGFFFGLGICAVDEHYGVGDWPTYEMMSRCEIRSLWVGVLVAIPSGAGVALAVLGEYTASLVGVAISASLLPPAVNAGLLWAMALVHLMFIGDDTRWNSVVKTAFYSNNQATELAVLGTVSLCLTLVNIICIFLVGVAVYKVKAVCPFERRDISWWRANKNLMKPSKNPKDDPSFTWDIYSNWCNEPQETKPESESKGANVGQIQSDTVTYRRQQPFQRLRAQNIEAYCNGKTQSMIGSYLPFDVETVNQHHIDNGIAENTDQSNKSDIMLNNETNMSSKKSTDCDSCYSFHNNAFEMLDDLNGKERPTLEPSLSFTVDPKKYGVVLGSNSYDV